MLIQEAAERKMGSSLQLPLCDLSQLSPEDCNHVEWASLSQILFSSQFLSLWRVLRGLEVFGQLSQPVGLQYKNGSEPLVCEW